MYNSWMSFLANYMRYQWLDVGDLHSLQSGQADEDAERYLSRGWSSCSKISKLRGDLGGWKQLGDLNNLHISNKPDFSLVAGNFKKHPEEDGSSSSAILGFKLIARRYTPKNLTATEPASRLDPLKQVCEVSPSDYFRCDLTSSFGGVCCNSYQSSSFFRLKHFCCTCCLSIFFVAIFHLLSLSDASLW